MKIRREVMVSGYAVFLLFILCTGCSSNRPRPKMYTVEIKQMKFQPAELVLQKGDTVLFINRDFLAHDVTEKAQKAWASGALSTNSSWRLVVSGSADYYCSIHPVMTGRLLIE